MPLQQPIPLSRGRWSRPYRDARAGQRSGALTWCREDTPIGIGDSVIRPGFAQQAELGNALALHTAVPLRDAPLVLKER
jgi:hypothetical protein